jgi:glycosyltransferase involved in cell wall biosynthesis
VAHLELPVVKLGFVNQPISEIVFAHGSEPLSNSSIGIVAHNIALQCKDRHDVSLISHAIGASGLQTLPGDIPLLIVPPTHISLRATRRLRGLLSEWRVDSRDRPPFAGRSYWAAYGKEVARIATERKFDYLLVQNFFQLVPIIKKYCTRTKIYLHMHCEWMTQINKAWVTEAVAQADLVSGVSNFISEKIRKQFPEHADKVFSLHNGVDTALFSPGELRTEDGELNILYVGRVSPEKGVHVLLEAFPLVKKAVPSARLTIIGWRGSAPYDYICRLDSNPLVQRMAPFFRSNDSYQKWLDALAAEGDGSVDFIPPMRHAELVDLYRKSDVFVLPSVGNEAFGIPVLEAMACGKPVVATFSGGIPESVKHNETGLLVERGDSSALAEAIIRLASDPSLRSRFGSSGQTFVHSNLTWGHVAKRLMDQIESSV